MNECKHNGPKDVAINDLVEPWVVAVRCMQCGKFLIHEEAITPMIPDSMTLIREMFSVRGLVWPNALEALVWATTEVGEAFEELMKLQAHWVRNNPEKEAAFDKLKLAYELGDIIMMVLVAAEAFAVDPIVAMEIKTATKIVQEHNKGS